MKNVIIAAVIALLVGAGAGYQAARMKYKTLLSDKDGLIGKQEQMLGDQKKQVEAAMTARTEESKANTHYIMNGGRMATEENKNYSPMEKDVTLTNGTKVMANGTIMTKDGKKVVLKEGQYIATDGTISLKQEAKK